MSLEVEVIGMDHEHDSLLCKPLTKDKTILQILPSYVITIKRDQIERALGD